MRSICRSIALIGWACLLTTQSGLAQAPRSSEAGSTAMGPNAAGPHVAGPHVAGPHVAGPHVTGPSSPVSPANWNQPAKPANSTLLSNGSHTPARITSSATIVASHAAPVAGRPSQTLASDSATRSTAVSTEQAPTATAPRLAVQPAARRAGFPSLRSGNASSAEPDAEVAEAEGSGPLITITSSLAVVLGLFAGMVWLSRRFGAKGLHQGSLPDDVLQSLGTKSLDARTRITMLRCGNRIVVVAQSATQIQTVAQITDPEEVRQLTAQCLGDAKDSFANTLQSFEDQPSNAGFAGVDRSQASDQDDASHGATSDRSRSRLFAEA